MKHPFLELFLFRKEHMQNELFKKCKSKHRWLGCDFVVWLEERMIHIYHPCASLRLYCSLKIWGAINFLFFIGVASRNSNFSLAYVSDTHYCLSSVEMNSKIDGIDCICLDQWTIQEVKNLIWLCRNFVLLWIKTPWQDFRNALTSTSISCGVSTAIIKHCIRLLAKI